MTSLRRPSQCIGLVVNPTAGGGREESAGIVRRLLSTLKMERFVAIEGTVESCLASELGVLEFAIPPAEASTLDARSAAQTLLQQGVDVLIGIGGDGTLCDIASAMIAAGSDAQLLGIGAGSANVGPLISLLGEDIARLSLDTLREATIHGIDVHVGDRFVGTAFNDVVLGNTFFGTRNGARTDLDAAAVLSGQDRIAEPKSVCGPETWIHKNDRAMLINEAVGFAQIIASPLNDSAPFAGKAISGLMCWGPYLGNHGVLAAASTVMVRTHLTLDDLTQAEPLRLEHLSFGEGDRIAIGGVRPNAVLIIDGNPLSLLSPSDVVTLRLRLDALRVLQPPSFASGLVQAEATTNPSHRKDPQ